MFYIETTVRGSDAVAVRCDDCGKTLPEHAKVRLYAPTMSERTIRSECIEHPIMEGAVNANAGR